VLIPLGSIVNPIQTELEVQTLLDRDPSSFSNSTSFFVFKIKFYTRVDQNFYIYLFNINADGQIDFIPPNTFNSNNHLRAGETPPSPRAALATSSPPVGQRGRSGTGRGQPETTLTDTDYRHSSPLVRENRPRGW